ncbi:hypothetical protein HMPREF3036_02132 [Sutterella sp. KLE1602]|nr:hypothetical protein HMPREF3036_02132 [Sutterella sp. KLE1602]
MRRNVETPERLRREHRAMQIKSFQPEQMTEMSSQDASKAVFAF